MTKPVLSIDLSALNLRAGVPGQYLGDIEIGGVPLHVELIRVERETGDAPASAHPGLQARIDAVRGFDEGDKYQTVRYRGGYYFVIAHPHQA